MPADKQEPGVLVEDADEWLEIPNLEVDRHETYVNNVSTSITHMTPDAARAAIETARNRFAIPAEEATKQEQHRADRDIAVSRQETWRFGIVGLCAIIAIAAIVWCEPGKGGWIAAIVSVFAGFVGAPPIIDRLKKAPSLTPRSAGKLPPEGSSL
jgi:hypothetical protein